MAGERQRIVFGLQQQDSAKSALDEEREKHRHRAERFGTDYQDPAKLPKFAQEARKERFKREGFTTGIDLFSEEELAKKAARAKKFGLTEDRQPLSCAPDPEELKRQARAKKFGTDYKPPTADTALQKADLYEPRKDAPEDVPRRETAIYLYGVDLMSSSDCLAYFDNYGPTLVEWINDSSCCVVFEDGASTRRAIAGTGHPLTPEELLSAPDGMDQHMMMDLDPAANIPYLWHKGRDFIKRVRDAKGKDKEVKVPLMYRMATDLDQKDPHAEKRSRYLWKGKRRFEDLQPEQQQQQQGRHKRGQGRRQHAHADDDAMQQARDHAADEGDDILQQEGKRGRGRRGGRRGRHKQQQQHHYNGDVDMQDAEYEDFQYEDEGPVAAEEAEFETDLDAKALRDMLKQRDAARRAADEDLPFEEVPQPDYDNGIDEA